MELLNYNARLIGYDKRMPKKSWFNAQPFAISPESCAFSLKILVFRFAAVNDVINVQPQPLLIPPFEPTKRNT